MICYALICSSGHSFESWFKSSDAFASLNTSGHVECPTCGSTHVKKAIMAPMVSAAKQEAAPKPSPDMSLATPPKGELAEAIQALKKQIEDNSDYVGKDFATEARKIHEGEAPERQIHGEAQLKDAKALAEDGIPVMPLPFIPPEKLS